MIPKFAQPDDSAAQELWPWPSQFSQFHLDLADYRAAALKGPLHDHYLRRVAELEARAERGLLSLDDRINLGAYYIRLGRYKDAIRLLSEAQNNRHFMLQANLATAYELADPKDGGNLELASRSRLQAAGLLADNSCGVGQPDAQLLPQGGTGSPDVARTANEGATAPRRAADPAPGQPLPQRVRFVGPSGKYEAGTIAPKQWGEVPSDAIDVVMQLHLWLPFDNRLSWLLGELLNGLGDVRVRRR